MGASEEEKKSPGLPAWQQNANDQSPPKEPSNPSTRESVIEQARKFLQDDEVRNSTTDKKIAFLESKGLESDEIQELLGVTRNPEASSSPPEVRNPFHHGLQRYILIIGSQQLCHNQIPHLYLHNLRCHNQVMTYRP